MTSNAVLIHQFQTFKPSNFERRMLVDKSPKCRLSLPKPANAVSYLPAKLAEPADAVSYLPTMVSTSSNNKHASSSNQPACIKQQSTSMEQNNSKLRFLEFHVLISIKWTDLIGLELPVLARTQRPGRRLPVKGKKKKTPNFPHWPVVSH